MRIARWPRPEQRDRFGFTDWQSLVRAMGAGLVGAGGALLLFGNSLREACFVGIGWAAMFAVFSWLVGQERWSWPKAALGFVAMVVVRLLGVVLAASVVETGDVTEGLASGGGAALGLLLLAWWMHRRDKQTAEASR